MENQKNTIENFINLLVGNNTNDDTSNFTQYDTPEQIQKCLHCKKEECNNCLKHVNFV